MQTIPARCDATRRQMRIPPGAVARQLWVGADVFGEFSESVRVHTLATKNYVPKAGIKVGSGTTTSSTMLSPHLIKKPLTCPPEEDKLKEA
jgi:hypothetical protein